jgi:hypothetical protein
MRRIISEGMLHKSVDKKYINYNVFGKKDNTHKFIILPSNINCMDLIRVHIAEGAFDILSVKYNLRGVFESNIQNDIFCAVAGNEYLTVLRYLIGTLGLMNIELHLYLDNDVNGRNPLDNIIRYVNGIPMRIFTHYNRIGKDMGVRKEDIDEMIIKNR